MLRIRKLFKKKFVKNVMTVASGTIVAQSIIYLLLPLITRFYGPEAYGLMGIFLSMIAIIVPISALTFPIAIVLPKAKEEAVSIVNVSLKILLLIFFVSSLFLALFSEELIKMFQLEEIGNYIFLIPIAILFSGLLQIIRQWSIRNQEFKSVAKAVVAQPLVVYGGMVIIGLFFPYASVLILFIALRHGIEALVMYNFNKKTKNPLKLKLEDSKLNFKRTFKKYNDFPIYRAPEALISAVSQNLPVMLLASLLNPTYVGFYSLARMSLSAPGQLIGKAVGDVFYPRIADALNNNENLYELIKKATFYLFAIGLIPFGFVIVFGPWIFSLVFGEDWIIAGEYAQWIAIMTLAMFISRPATQALPVLNAQKFHLIFTITLGTARLISLYFGLLLFEDIVAMALFGCSSAVLYVLLIFITLGKSKKVMQKR